MNDFDISFDDTKIIRDFEGHSLIAYKCPAGIWTISYGITGPNITKGMVITDIESKQLFMERIELVVNQIKPLLKIELNKNQFIAILSFVWNLGIGAFSASTLLKLINTKDFEEAAKQFSRWVKADGKTLPGLVTRRKKEATLFLQPV